MLIFAGTYSSSLNCHTLVTIFIFRAFVEQGTWYQPNRGFHIGGQVH